MNARTQAPPASDPAPASAPPVGLVTWRAIPGKRRGVVAVRDCKAGTELERSIVIYVPDRDLVERDDPPTVHDEYLLYWSDEPERQVVMGTRLLVIYNHSP